MCFVYKFVVHLVISLSLHLGRISTSPKEEPQLTNQPRRKNK